MAEKMIDRIAKAIKAETDKFDMPVNFYIEPEAGARFERDNPGKDRFLDAELDELESYRIIARVAVAAMREPTPAMSGEFDGWNASRNDMEACYEAAIEAALKE
ncbi:hypothetical protein PCC82_04855 [Agrobacterium deltaense]